VIGAAVTTKGQECGFLSVLLLRSKSCQGIQYTECKKVLISSKTRENGVLAMIILGVIHCTRGGGDGGCRS
jgi:hypothetical protein